MKTISCYYIRFGKHFQWLERLELLYLLTLDSNFDVQLLSLFKIRNFINELTLINTALTLKRLYHRTSNRRIKIKTGVNFSNLSNVIFLSFFCNMHSCDIFKFIQFNSVYDLNFRSCFQTKVESEKSHIKIWSMKMQLCRCIVLKTRIPKQQHHFSE